ncbi:LacI family DNA-binding transcriptional regulator [Herbiconiux sp. L3-i23]|uniref:LacI family DNA-binding transcriptional regulator n=1 Tax=Herbiconiux sp. L3-i23 TaxID=2905871 RepID=UPI0020562F8B|nr:LacI family DNA-binding transcriptional regulator [Herbiconiux sp. L3-i23]BDI22091.1 LacI family transcriptional regulator [Herbiconiux sp. L3-i23]
MATIYEVAARAGVSPATVSRVLNGTAVAADLAERVRSAAAELDYTPNRSARSLRRAHSELIALVIPDIENPFFTALARGVEDVAREAGFSVVLCNTDDDLARESDYLRVALAERMAGVVLAPASERSDLSGLVAAGRPIVAVDRAPHEHSVDIVTVDNVAAGRHATEALIARGARRIACITGPAGVDTADGRAEGWRAALTEAGLPADESLVVRSDFRQGGGRESMEALLARGAPVDAAVIANSVMAVGVARALRGAGRSLPLAVIGDLPIGFDAPDDLIALPLPARELGASAARRLLERISGDVEPARSLVLPA